MKIENQCCSLEQAKKLKELGVIQESAHYFMRWSIPEASEEFNIISADGLSDCKDNPIVYPEWVSAYGVAELGVMLGNGITAHRPKPGDNEAVDRADDLIHMLEIGELLVEGVNERLIK